LQSSYQVIAFLESSITRCLIAFFTIQAVLLISPDFNLLFRHLPVILIHFRAANNDFTTVDSIDFQWLRHFFNNLGLILAFLNDLYQLFAQLNRT